MVSKGYVMEVRANGSYCYLFTEKATKASAMDEYKKAYGTCPKYSEVIKRSGKVESESEYAKTFCINL